MSGRPYKSILSAVTRKVNVTIVFRGGMGLKQPNLTIYLSPFQSGFKTIERGYRLLLLSLV